MKRQKDAAICCGGETGAAAGAARGAEETTGAGPNGCASGIGCAGYSKKTNSAATGRCEIGCKLSGEISTSARNQYAHSKSSTYITFVEHPVK